MHLSSDSRYEEVSHFFFGSVVARHSEDHQSFVGRGRGAEDWACNKMRMGMLRNEAIQFAWMFE
jgi:hypothetical protein